VRGGCGSQGRSVVSGGCAPRGPVAGPGVRDGEWREMGMTDAEYSRAVELLGRPPNRTELGMFAVLWSEHCAYKHSRETLKLLPTESARVLQGPGENAGVVDLGNGWAAAWKAESHNHPSAVEPFQGAATGIGGIVRDVLSMGARPVAPTVGGDLYFEEAYSENPLVNVMCVGLVRSDRLFRAVASGTGNPVLLVGSRTGRDGIHGATFASEELGEESEERRPSVQVGDPFTEKLLIEACLEALSTGHVVGIQDLGAAGLTSSSAEMAARAGSGVELDVGLVPRREAGMDPYEVMLSESQERMLLVVERGREREVAEVFEKWGLTSSLVGRVVPEGVLRVREGDREAASVPVTALTRGAPARTTRPVRPEWLDEALSLDESELPDPRGETLEAAFARLVSSPNIGSRQPIWRQYDHMVGVNTIVLPGADAAVIRIKGTPSAIAMSTDANGRHCYLDPYGGGAAAVAEAARNVAMVGAEPIGLTNCLNFGNPERDEVFWQFQECVRGMADACRALAIPVTGGNVSFYNEAGDSAVYPTPMIGMLGLVEDRRRMVGPGFREAGDLIVLIGPDRHELGGSEYLRLMKGRAAGTPARVDLDVEARVQRACLAAIRRGILRSAHDCSDGGVAVAAAECCIASGATRLGAEIHLEARDARPDAVLFGEAPSRVVASVSPRDLASWEDVAGRLSVPWRVVGRVVREALTLTVDDGRRTSRVTARLSQVESLWRGALSCLER